MAAIFLLHEFLLVKEDFSLLISRDCALICIPEREKYKLLRMSKDTIDMGKYQHVFQAIIQNEWLKRLYFAIASGNINDKIYDPLHLQIAIAENISN